MNNKNASAPAHQTVEPKPNSPIRADISGRVFLHFQRLTGGACNLRTGRVVGALGNDRWLLEFNAGAYRFCNVFSAAQLEDFVLVDSDADAKAFVAALGANPLALPDLSPLGRGMPAGNA